MPKRSRVQIYEDYKKILLELEKNSKERTDNLVKTCGFSRQKLIRSIKILEKNKMIWGYNTVVDDNKMNRKRFFILLKRSQKPISEESIDIVINRNLKNTANKHGIRIEDSYYINGFYDWIMCITATDIKHVKKFSDSFSKVFKGMYLSDIQILEVLFPIERNGFVNPNREKLKEFFIK